MSQFIVIEVTTATRDEASRIAERLVEHRLAACVQIVGPVSSIYRWDGEIETGEEFQLQIKTRKSLFANVAKLVASLHSYDQPQIIALPIVAGSDGYLQWLCDETLDSEDQN